MVTFKKELSKLYYIQHTPLSNIEQLPKPKYKNLISNFAGKNNNKFSIKKNIYIYIYIKSKINII